MISAAVALRRMRWWDLAEVVVAERSIFPDAPWSQETFWSELAGVPDSRHYIVAEIAGSIAGYAGLMAVGPTADVQTVAVAAQFRRTGVARTMIRALLDEAVRRRCSEVLLEVRADNEGAQRLYEQFGFERIAVRRGYYQPENVDAIIMRKRPLAL